jgi:hypothetical protein
MTSEPLVSWGRALALTAVVAAAVLGFYLSIYPSAHIPSPIGWDTPRYLWRTTLVRAVGIVHLQSVVPRPVTPDPSRPAFPVLASVLSSLTGTSPFRVAAVLPSMMAAAIGLAAGAFVAATLRRPAWQLAVVAVGVAVSAFMVRLEGPEAYQDNLFAAAVITSAALAIAIALEDRQAVLPAIALLGVAGVIHWAFFSFIAATLLLTAAGYAAGSWRDWRSGRRRLLETPAGRIASILVGSAAIAAITIFAVLGGDLRPPRLTESEFEKKLALDLPRYRFPLVLPIALIGILSLVVAVRRAKGERHDRTRFVLTVLLAWCAVALAGVLAFTVLGVEVPAHRFLAFGLAIPLLAVLGLLWIAGAAGGAAGRVSSARLSKPVSVGVVILALGGAAWLAHGLWFRTRSFMDTGKVQDAATAGAYLDAAHVGPGRPVVFIVLNTDGSNVALMGHLARAALPATRIEHLYIYAGAPQDYLAGRATPDASGEPDPLSERYLAPLLPTYDQDPVAVVLSSFNDIHYHAWVAEHPETQVGPGVAVVRGPGLAHPVHDVPSPIRPARTVGLAVLAGVALGALWLCGIGWVRALLGPWLRPAEAAALAPAVGVGAVVVAGIAIDRVGIRLVGVRGMLPAVLVALTGWIAAWVSARGRPSAAR